MESTRSKASEAMARYAQGDAAAFAQVYDELGPKLHGYLRRKLKNAAAADDVLQQVFLRMHHSRSRFAPGARVEPWAYAIAHSAAVDFIRSEQRRAGSEFLEEAHADEQVDLDASVGAGELSDALRRELAQVSPKLREAFLLTRIEGLTHAEAAQVLGAEETATKVRAHRASVWLRERLSRFGLTEDGR
ncbi:MAG: RNA polymerase sigma factor [Myxococcales bacterium]